MTSDKSDTALLDEAAMLFLALSEDPDNPELAKDRDAFLARGKAERAAYRKIETGWVVSGGRTRSRTPLVFAILGALGAATYLASEPVFVRLTADFSTSKTAQITTLASGDVAHLDASSAVVDGTEDGTRKVKLLRGSAFFDVVSDGRPFIVALGEAEVSVRGTAFETAYLPDGLSVSVTEGIVYVRVEDMTWQLEAGQSLTWSQENGVSNDIIPVEDIASWRTDQLVAEDMSIDRVVDILERRLPGSVMVVGRDLSETRVSGTFDLDDPHAALRSLALIANARYVSGMPFVSVLMAKD